MQWRDAAAEVGKDATVDDPLGEDASTEVAALDASPEADSYESGDLDVLQDSQDEDVAIESSPPCVHVGEQCMSSKCCGSLTCDGWVCTDADGGLDAKPDTTPPTCPEPCAQANYPYEVQGVGSPGGIVANCPPGATLSAVQNGWCDCSQGAYSTGDGWACFPPNGEPCGVHIRCDGPYCLSLDKPCE